MHMHRTAEKRAHATFARPGLSRMVVDAVDIEDGAAGREAALSGRGEGREREQRQERREEVRVCFHCGLVGGLGRGGLWVWVMGWGWVKGLGLGGE